jgi:hypothetical protein
LVGLPSLSALTVNRLAIRADRSPRGPVRVTELQAERHPCWDNGGVAPPEETRRLTAVAARLVVDRVTTCV